MTLTTQDLQAIEKLIKTTVKPIVEVVVDDRVRITEDLLRQELGSQIKASEKRVLEGVGDIVDNGIHPQLEDYEERIIKLETKTA